MPTSNRGKKIPEETREKVLRDIRDGIPVCVTAERHSVSRNFVLNLMRRSGMDTSRSASHKRAYHYFIGTGKFDTFLSFSKLNKSDEVRKRMSESRIRIIRSEATREKYGMRRNYPNMILPLGDRHKSMMRRKAYMKRTYGYKYGWYDRSNVIRFDSETRRNEMAEAYSRTKYGIVVLGDEDVDEKKVTVVPSWDDKQGGFNVD